MMEMSDKLVIEIVNASDLILDDQVISNDPYHYPLSYVCGQENYAITCMTHLPVCHRQRNSKVTLIARHWSYTYRVLNAIFKFPVLIVEDESLVDKIKEIDKCEAKLLFPSSPASKRLSVDVNSATNTRRSAKASGQICPFCGGILRVLLLNLNPEFLSFEFRDSSGIGALFQMIKSHGFMNKDDVQENPLRLINSLLRVPNFMERTKTIKLPLNFSDEVNRRSIETETFRDRSYSELSRAQGTKIRILNRLIIEELCPDKAPQLKNREKNNKGAIFVACENRSNKAIGEGSGCDFFAALTEVEARLFEKQEFPSNQWIVVSNEKCPRCGSEIVSRTVRKSDGNTKPSLRCRNNRNSLFSKCSTEGTKGSKK